MRILHISDFHYNPDKYNKYDQNKIFNSLFAQLRKQGQIDFVVFTGDLVYSGENPDHFKSAYDYLIGLLDGMNISKDNFLICAGNHDVDRSQIGDALKVLFQGQIKGKEIKDNQSLNTFFTGGSIDLDHSFGPLKNYNDFLKNAVDGALNSELESLNCIYKRQITDKQVGFVALNSSWCSVGDSDEGILLLPSIVIKNSVEKVKDCDVKILLMHHPLHWFKNFNSIELIDLIHRNFDMVFSGHIHRNQVSTYYSANNGIFHNIAAATLSYNISDRLGYSIIELTDWISKDIKLTNVTYNLAEDLVNVNEPIIIKMPVGEEKDQQNKFRRKITGKFNSELDNANDLILNMPEDEEINFLTIFNNPVLKTKSKAGINASENMPQIDFVELMNSEDNYVVFGNDKCGKTSLLKRLQLHFLEKYSTENKVPFYLDYKELESKLEKNFNFTSLISRYFEISKREAGMLFNNSDFRLFIDNFDRHSPLTKILVNFLEEFPKVKFTICAEYTTSREVEEFEIDDRVYTKLYFHDLTRTELRLYSDKLTKIKKEDKEDVLEKIVTLCKQLELPLNYWTVSLLLFVYKKQSENYFKNIFEILDLCIDEILNKKLITLSKSKVTFDQLKRVCGEIAHFLYTQKFESIYSASRDEIRNVIKSHIDSNLRLSAEPDEILNYFISTGIFKNKHTDDYTFRLNGIFEYFLAYYMTKNDAFKNEILIDETKYLSFKNELEIYTGFVRNDVDILQRVFEKTKQKLQQMSVSYDKSSIDEILLSKVQLINLPISEIKKLATTSSISREEKDQLFDSADPININSEVHLKPNIEHNSLNSDLVERYLSILSKVFKNSEEIESDTLTNEVFDFLLNNYCFFGFYLIDEIQISSFEELLTLEDGENEVNLLKFVTGFIPIIIQLNANEGLGHYNLEKLIKLKISKLSENKHKNQYYLFLLHSILVDIDLKNNKASVQELLDNITIGVLKYAVFMKLQFYLTFKAFDNKNTEAYLREKIQEAKINLDSGSNLGGLHKNIESSKKNYLFRKKNKI